jgi:hypothetical protein
MTGFYILEIPQIVQEAVYRKKRGVVVDLLRCVVRL